MACIITQPLCTNWSFSSPGCVMPTLKVVYMCVVWITLQYSKYRKYRSGTSPISYLKGYPHFSTLLNGPLLNYYYTGTEESTWKTGIKLLGNYCLSPWPRGPTLLLKCSPGGWCAHTVRWLGEKHKSIPRTLPIQNKKLKSSCFQVFILFLTHKRGRKRSSSGERQNLARNWILSRI